MARLELQGLSKSFGATPVLHGIDLVLADGEMLVIVGASGCGKSTLLRLVAGLEVPSTGRVLLDGARHHARRSVAAGYCDGVPELRALSAYERVREHGLWADTARPAARGDRPPGGRGRGDCSASARCCARKPRQLSGGQRQRVAMGRAIVREPKLFLFDEPLSNLDAKLRVQMRAEIRRLQRRLGVTSLYVTHDQVEAMTLGDRLLVLHQGRAAQIATPMEVFERPANTYVAGFIGAPAMNFCPARLTSGGMAAELDAGGRVGFTDGRRDAPDGTRLLIGIRPQHAVLAGEGIDLVVDLIEPLGSETLIHGHLSDGTAFAVRVAGSPGAVPDGAHLRVALPGEQLHVFDAGSGDRRDPAS